MARLAAKCGSRLRPCRRICHIWRPPFFLPIARMHQVPDSHPLPFNVSKKCRLGSKFTVRALLCALSASFRFRLQNWAISNARREDRLLEPTRRPSKGQKLITETSNAGLALCSPFCLHKKSQLDVITTQRRQKNVAQLLAMAVRAELLSDDWSRLRRRFVGRSKPSTFPWRLCRLSFLKKKKKRAISPPEVILPSFKRAISLAEVVLPKKRSLQGNIGQSGPVFRASDWSLP